MASVFPVVRPITVFITNEAIKNHGEQLRWSARSESYRMRMASRALDPAARINQVSAAVINSAMRVHSILGPGLLESAYARFMKLN